jgi:hypothetical protein
MIDRKLSGATDMIARTAQRFMLFLISILFVTNSKWSDARSTSAAYDAIDLISSSAVWTRNFDTTFEPQGMAWAPDGPWRLLMRAGRVTPQWRRSILSGIVAAGHFNS